MNISKVLSIGIIVTALSSTILASTSGTHWGYTGHEGPANWASLSPEYSMCKEGNSQSPINITKNITVQSKGLEKIAVKYTSCASSVVNNGHTVQVNINEGSKVKVDGIEFELKQIHFHTPSENHIEGKSFPLEAHLVHAAQDGSLAVLAVLFEEGRRNLSIKRIWNKLPNKPDAALTCSINSKVLKGLLPKDKSYYKFNGSLTTPPCSEGVRWLVFKNTLTVSTEQVKEFLSVIKHENNRPIQAINDRKVMK